MKKQTFKILDEYWEISLVKPSDAHLVVEGTYRIGATWSLTKEIYLSEDLDLNTMLNTARHELCHAYIAATQVNSDLEWNEEAVCEMMAIYGPLIVHQADTFVPQLVEEYCAPSCTGVAPAGA